VTFPNSGFAVSWFYEGMGVADLLIFLFAALADVLALVMLRRMRRRDRVYLRVKRSMDQALRDQPGK